MSEPQTATPPQGERDQMMSALFAQLVMQQANLAMMLLGKVAHPESGQVVKDIEGARLFIDQLEMLEVKTRGNLNKEETALLKQSLMSLRLAFVEAVEAPDAAGTAKPKEAAAPAPAGSSPTPEAAAAEDDEHRKKFSKKY
jgi:hypothetical protein